ncbi:hypothetical protein PF004_g29842 [Phytophthora fragariae]|uniref:Uncharacterized protein n=2 Tax=Phytophthora fragariae TaxID=53985 RepID=A0A6G0MDL4_9STRA|nr:hypothetical protein PF004_g29842 [Phytophthora fragariae]
MDMPALESEFSVAVKAISSATSPSVATKPDQPPVSTSVKRGTSKRAKAAAAKGSTSASTANAHVVTKTGTSAATTTDARERLRYPELVDSSDRLGGEASYTKQKRLKAEKAAVELKRKVNEAVQAMAFDSNDLVKTAMVLRADGDRDERVRVEAAEAKRRAEREALEERRREERREEREAMEERHLEERRPPCGSPGSSRSHV